MTPRPGEPRPATDATGQGDAYLIESGTRSPRRSLGLTTPKVTACLMSLAGLTHLALVPGQWSHAPAHGLFFLAAGLAEIVWAAAYWRQPTRRLAYAGLALAGGLVVLWGLTRLFPAPFGHGPERVDGWGLATKAIEIAAVWGMVGRDARNPGRAAAQAIGLSLVAAFAALAAGAAAEPLFPALGSSAHEVAAAHPAGDHGAAYLLRLDGERAGPYRLQAFTLAAQEQNLVVEVGVLEADGGGPPPQARVSVQAAHLTGTDPAVRSAAVPEGARIPGDVVARLAVAGQGTWRVTVLVDGPLGHGEAAYLENVSRPAAVGDALAYSLPVLVTVVVVAVLLLLPRREASA